MAIAPVRRAHIPSRRGGGNAAPRNHPRRRRPRDLGAKFRRPHDAFATSRSRWPPRGEPRPRFVSLPARCSLLKTEVKGKPPLALYTFLRLSFPSTTPAKSIERIENDRVERPIGITSAFHHCWKAGRRSSVPVAASTYSLPMSPLHPTRNFRRRP